MAGERITAVKKSSLDGLAEGWGAECFAIVRQASYDDMRAIDEIDPLKEQGKAVELQEKIVTEHFISGKIKVWNTNGEQELVEMTREDATASIAVCDKLYADIIGLDLDPKDIKAAALAAEKQSEDVVSTETSSSMGKLPDSPEPPSES